LLALIVADHFKFDFSRGEKMARFPEFANWSRDFREWTAEFDRNNSEALRCFLVGDTGCLLC